MLFNIPQFIDKEDKIVGPLTAKQLGWLAGAGVVLMVLWNILDQATFIISSIPISAFFGLMAFYRPQGQPLINFLLSSIYFSFRPKMYLWKRIESKESGKKENLQNIHIVKAKKTITAKKVAEVTKLLDQK